MTHPASVVPAAPIACTLLPGAYDERLAFIAALNRTLLRHAQSDLTLELHYPVPEKPRVRELVRHEQACCAFLDFDVRESSTGVGLRITAPVEARDTIEGIFVPFLSGVGAARRADVSDDNRRLTSGHASASESSGITTCSTDPFAPCGCSPLRASSAQAASTRTGPADAVMAGERDASGPSRTSRAGAMTTAGLAVACGVCCLLPFALPAVALTAFGGVVATVASAYRWAVTVAVGAMVTGWAWVLWQSVRSHRAPARSTLRAMSVASLLLVVALAWPTLERSIISWLRA